MLNAGQDLAAVLQTLEVSEATYHRWWKKYAWMRSTRILTSRKLVEATSFGLSHRYNFLAIHKSTGSCEGHLNFDSKTLPIKPVGRILAGLTQPIRITDRPVACFAANSTTASISLLRQLFLANRSNDWSESSFESLSPAPGPSTRKAPVTIVDGTEIVLTHSRCDQ
jgi:hypothetical protein